MKKFFTIALLIVCMVCNAQDKILVLNEHIITSEYEVRDYIGYVQSYITDTAIIEKTEYEYTEVVYDNGFRLRTMNGSKLPSHFNYSFYEYDIIGIDTVFTLTNRYTNETVTAVNNYSDFMGTRCIIEKVKVRTDTVWHLIDVVTGKKLKTKVKDNVIADAVPKYYVSDVNYDTTYFLKRLFYEDDVPSELYYHTHLSGNGDISGDEFEMAVKPRCDVKRKRDYTDTLFYKSDSIVRNHNYVSFWNSDTLVTACTKKEYEENKKYIQSFDRLPAVMSKSENPTMAYRLELNYDSYYDYNVTVYQVNPSSSKKIAKKFVAKVGFYNNINELRFSRTYTCTGFLEPGGSSFCDFDVYTDNFDHIDFISVTTYFTDGSSTTKYREYFGEYIPYKDAFKFVDSKDEVLLKLISYGLVVR